MKQSEWLYGPGFDPRILQELTYVQALHRKIIWAKEFRDELLKEPYAVHATRVSDISKAIKFNEVLIDEVFGKDER